jgi:hypothetical protein
LKNKISFAQWKLIENYKKNIGSVFYPPQDAPSETFRVYGKVSVFSDKFLRLFASGFPLLRE